MNLVGRFGLGVVAAIFFATAVRFQTSALRSTAARNTISTSSRDITIGISAEGYYSVFRHNPMWKFEGDLGHTVTNIARRHGADQLGHFTALTFDWVQQGRKSGEIRVYDDRQLVLFTLICRSVQPAAPEPFPALHEPKKLHTFGYADANFAPPTFATPAGGSPWMWFDDSAHGAILSPASNFMIADLYRDNDGSVASGWVSKLANIPEGFTHQTLLAFGDSIQETWKTWGEALTDLGEKVCPPNDADVSLKTFGYWTDAGSGYYYNYDANKGYAGTLLAVRDRMRALGIPLGYMQLDSWWYLKTSTGPDGRRNADVKNDALPVSQWNCYGGLTEYVADRDVFPKGLAAFQKQLGLPLITHNRWVDLNSPYRQRYFVSGIAAIDPKWWEHIAGFLQSSGVVGYEQDWLSAIYQQSPQMQSMSTVAGAFTDNMSRATEQRGISIQYSMTLPRYYMQGSRYGNLTSVRVSNDRFSPSRWENFLYTSQLASALGEWPWADACRSAETANLLLATLSGGPVGVGDSISEIDPANIQKAIRPDGVIVKPDTSIVPLDSTYLTDAVGRHRPMVAAAFTEHGSIRTAYVFAFPRPGDISEVLLRPAELGIGGECWVYDAARGIGSRIPSGGTFRATFPDPTTQRDWSYFIVAPTTRSGISLLGDAGRFVSLSHRRVTEISELDDGLNVSVAFAPNEGPVELHGFSQYPIFAEAALGSCGHVRFDPATHEFHLTVGHAVGATSAVVSLSTNVVN